MYTDDYGTQPFLQAAVQVDVLVKCILFISAPTNNYPRLTHICCIHAFKACMLVNETKSTNCERNVLTHADHVKEL